ncbi:hypothetical protein [Corynebacterium alimapuense]|nr:hypothetical protein [Corynebacterium alimapuense]
MSSAQNAQFFDINATTDYTSHHVADIAIIQVFRTIWKGAFHVQ